MWYSVGKYVYPIHPSDHSSRLPVFQTLTTSYASEVAPVALRGYLTTWVNACWGIGQLISLGVLRGLLHRTDQWGWRIPYAIQVSLAS